MSTYLEDLAWRVVRTGTASGAGVLVIALHSSLAWWAAPVAAALSFLVAIASAAASPQALASAVEKSVWTLAQVVVAALPATLGGMPAAYVPLIAAGLAALKGLFVKLANKDATKAAFPRRFAL